MEIKSSSALFKPTKKMEATGLPPTPIFSPKLSDQILRQPSCSVLLIDQIDMSLGVK